ncbi:MAG: tRNA pseudouridine(38-40) synthase TruA [Myxococcales bacterium]|nr:MAG: tRNA pseudouridine(38-40) synthase TruA [Myxococcales bacterium]
MARKIRLLIEYEGTAYYGWQMQTPERVTIQALLEEAVRRVTGGFSRVHGAGRTDAGVHAFGQVATFITECRIPGPQIAKALNTQLPRDVCVLKSEDVEMDFDARRHARGKIYQYHILNRDIRSGLLRHRAGHVREALDLERMRQAARHLQGEHDFTSFQAAGCAAKHAVRYIYKLDLARANFHPDVIVLEIFATAYLKHMVRNIAGTLIEVGAGRREPEDLAAILAAKDRRAAGQTAAPGGLYLVKIFYLDDPPPPELMRLIPPSHLLKRDLYRAAHPGPVGDATPPQDDDGDD